MIYTQDGRAYAGATSFDVVCRMLEAGLFTRSKRPEDYMQAVSGRALRLDHQDIRFDTADNFLTDLNAHNIIEIGAAQ